MNNTTSFSIATAAALVSVYALWALGLALEADYYAPALDQQIPAVAFGALTIFSGIGAFLVAGRLKKTANPVRNVWIAVLVVFAFFLLPVPGIADPIAAAILLAIHFAVAIPLALAMRKMVSQ